MATVVDPMPALKPEDGNDDRLAVPYDPSEALTPQPDRGWELSPVKAVPAARPAWLPEGYDDASFIGSGGQAEVWRARQIGTGRVVCIKRYRARAGHGFYRELMVMLSVHAPNLVELVEVLDTASGQMLVMEYCSGGTVRGRLDSTGPLGVRDGVELGVQCLRGLRALRSHNLVHADLKPENIFISRRTGAPLYKLADFGIARTTTQFHHTPRLFSQAYAAPEQVAGFAIPASDIYSLCVILGEVMGGDVRRGMLPGNLPGRLVALLIQGVSTDAANRPSLEDIEAALEAARTELIASDYVGRDDEENDL